MVDNVNSNRRPISVNKRGPSVVGLSKSNQNYENSWCTNRKKNTSESNLYRFSAHCLRDEQMKDPVLRQIITWIETNDARPGWNEILQTHPAIRTYWLHWDQLKVVNGFSSKRWISNSGEKEELKLVVPFQLRSKVFHDVYERNTGGNYGKTKTMKRVTCRYWWVGWRNYVVRSYKKCDSCATRKPPKRTHECPHVPTERNLTNLTNTSENQKTLSYEERPIVFELGDKVFLKNTQNPKGSDQIFPLREGPFLILERLCDVLYKIQKSHMDPPKVVYGSLLRTFWHREIRLQSLLN